VKVFTKKYLDALPNKFYISASGEIFSKREKINTAGIVPIIKPASCLEQVAPMAVYEKYNNELLITYAEDTGNSIRYLTQQDIDLLALDLDLLRSIAVNNLNSLLTDIKLHGDGSVYMLTAGGDYETSLILLSYLFTKQNMPVDGDFVIAIPNCDLLLITGSNNKAGIHKIKEIAARAFLTGSCQVSEYLYKWNGDKFEKFE
jgi:uncharacterized protein YtpQ (UPF0354 family)